MWPSPNLFISKQSNLGRCERGDFLESEYIRIAGKSDIAIGKMKKVTLDDKEILIANVDGNYYAIGNVCTHFGGDLSQGVLEGNIITCPNHEAKFDVTTGKVVSPPTEALSRPDIDDEPQYSIKGQNNKIMVKL